LLRSLRGFKDVGKVACIPVHGLDKDIWYLVERVSCRRDLLAEHRAVYYRSEIGGDTRTAGGGGGGGVAAEIFWLKTRRLVNLGSAGQGCIEEGS